MARHFVSVFGSHCSFVLVGETRRESLKGREERVEFERGRRSCEGGLKGVWRGFHTVAPANSHLSTIGFKACLEIFFYCAFSLFDNVKGGERVCHHQKGGDCYGSMDDREIGLDDQDQISIGQDCSQGCDQDDRVGFKLIGPNDREIGQDDITNFLLIVPDRPGLMS
ncbi:hypothetical protein KFK09_004690 [Dendrobium nobile]|uniref:Uncharacterized protein n=1 Tax=Dendrobium nobile TaxID=94219 RepID=A0A8T3BX35_DENNO|nr:hypothetical protein KFK09_004690 [Dendrobium nobile]